MQPGTGTQSMVRHFGMFQFKSDIRPDQIEHCFSEMKGMVGQIPGLLRAHFGPNVSPEGLSQGFGDGFVMDLEDAAARDRYLADPAHKAAGASLVAALEGGTAGLLVFDLEI